MDDLLEKPSASILNKGFDTAGDVEQSSDEDDGGPDWTKLSVLTTASSSKPAIPKRGDKEFEPVGGVDGGGRGTSLQQHKLERVRRAMFSALDVERTVSSKVVSYAVWCSDISRARILHGRGAYLTSMGYNVPREAHASTSIGDGAKQEIRAEKTIELLPEEALYLMERGSLFCWSQIGDETAGEGTPMSVQQGYAEMIGKEDLTLERYLVYAYLKRLGYTVTRARAPDPYYNAPASLSSLNKQTSGPQILARVSNLFLSVFNKFFGLPLPRVNWWQPLGYGFVHPFLSYSTIFSLLRFIPSGYSQPLRTTPPPNRPSPYEVFFHVYKPATPYRKTAPPQPDYSLIVVDARKTPMPSLQELCTLFDQLAELPPPTPRKRHMQALRSGSAAKKSTQSQNRPNETTAESIPLYMRLRNLLQRVFRFAKATDEQNISAGVAPRRPNPFQLLKMGKKMIVVATVDSGMISFYRFCQGSFDEWPMV